MMFPPGVFFSPCPQSPPLLPPFGSTFHQRVLGGMSSTENLPRQQGYFVDCSMATASGTWGIYCIRFCDPSLMIEPQNQAVSCWPRAEASTFHQARRAPHKSTASQHLPGSHTLPKSQPLPPSLNRCPRLMLCAHKSQAEPTNLIIRPCLLLTLPVSSCLIALRARVSNYCVNLYKSQTTRVWARSLQYFFWAWTKLSSLLYLRNDESLSSFFLPFFFFLFRFRYLRNCSDTAPASRSNSAALIAMMDQSFQALRVQLSELFGRKLRRNMLLLTGIWFGLSFGFYGLSIWLPTFFRKGGIDDDANIYEISFYVSVSNLPGNLACLWALDRIGSKATLAISMWTSAASVLTIFAVHSSTGTTVFSCAFSGLSVAGWNSLDVLSAELFPTELRGTAFGALAGFGRVGAVVANVLFGSFGGHAAVPLVLASAAIGMGATLALFLPSTKGAFIH
eukprot:m.63245 g.63245  ORF g.63245 m.63245 type:complete len:450 (-) comp13437_c0_seq1:26-1375(-)